MTTPPAAVLDHCAVATRQLDDAYALFGQLLGGRWRSGSSREFWWGQLAYAAGPTIELLTPTDDPGSAFLERFLTTRGPGPHHLNFHVADIRATLAAIDRLGIEPVGVSLTGRTWQEAFLRPKDAQGIVIQVAQLSGASPAAPAPAGLGVPGEPCAFTLIEHRVDDLPAAVELFTGALGGEVAAAGPGRAEVTWPGGRQVRLVTGGQDETGGRTRLHFARTGAPFTASERDRAAELAGRLGVRLGL
jgi:methylmalonyl-CoA/ethylmalonyl-CoA epimerase